MFSTVPTSRRDRWARVSYLKLGDFSRCKRCSCCLRMNITSIIKCLPSWRRNGVQPHFFNTCFNWTTASCIGTIFGLLERRKDETVTQKSTWGRQILRVAGKLPAGIISDAVSRDWLRTQGRHRWRRRAEPIRRDRVRHQPFRGFPVPIVFCPGTSKRSSREVTLVYTPKDIYGRQWTRKNYLRQEELRSRSPSQPCPGYRKRVDKQWLTDIFFVLPHPDRHRSFFPSSW